MVGLLGRGRTGLGVLLFQRDEICRCMYGGGTVIVRKAHFNPLQRMNNDMRATWDIGGTTTNETTTQMSILPTL
jgi:hypothetical protein